MEQRSAADVAQRTAASELAAEVDREQIAASAANQRRQTTQTITDAAGNTYAMNDGTLTPLTTPDGQPFKAATKTDNSQFDLAAKLLADSGGMMTPQQAAAQTRELQAAMTPGVQAAPSLDQFMAAAKQANPNATDEQLKTYYNQTYGR